MNQVIDRAKKQTQHKWRENEGDNIEHANFVSARLPGNIRSNQTHEGQVWEYAK